MISYFQGNLLTDDSEALVNTVNCSGVMGRGIALQFKEKFPDNFKAYSKACKNYEVHTGQMFVFNTGQLTNPRYIINFPTKRHWRSASYVEYIELGLDDLVKEVKEIDISSISIPPLGCGLGGLNWEDVRPLIEMKLKELAYLDIRIFEPWSK